MSSLYTFKGLSVGIELAAAEVGARVISCEPSPPDGVTVVVDHSAEQVLRAIRECLPLDIRYDVTDAKTPPGR